MAQEPRTVFHDLNGTPDTPAEEIAVDLTASAVEEPKVEVEQTDEPQIETIAVESEEPEVQTKPKHDSFDARLDRERRAKIRERERAGALEKQLTEERAEREKMNQRLVALEKTAPPPTAEIDLKLAKAKDELTTAIADGNPAEQVRLSSEISDLQLERRIANANATRAREQPQQPQPKERPAATTANPKAEQWKSRNAWFGKPEYRVQTAAAIEVAGLLEHDEGWDPNDDDFYAEVDKRVAQNVRIPRTKTNGSNVAGTGGQNPPSGNVVRLTRNDQEVMRTLKLDPTNPAHLKQYALEKRALQ